MIKSVMYLLYQSTKLCQPFSFWWFGQLYLLFSVTFFFYPVLFLATFLNVDKFGKKEYSLFFFKAKYLYIVIFHKYCVCRSIFSVLFFCKLFLVIVFLIKWIKPYWLFDFLLKICVIVSFNAFLFSIQNYGKPIYV